MIQQFRPKRKDDEIRVKMDITVDLPAEVADGLSSLVFTSLSGAFMIPTLAV